MKAAVSLRQVKTEQQKKAFGSIEMDSGRFFRKNEELNRKTQRRRFVGVMPLIFSQ